MKKILRIMIVSLALLLVLGLAACSLIIDQSLVGKWSLSNVQIAEFSSDGTFIWGVEGFTTTYKYSALGGKGEYWISGKTELRNVFTYSITGSALTLTISDIPYTLNKM